MNFDKEMDLQEHCLNISDTLLKEVDAEKTKDIKSMPKRPKKNSVLCSQ